jgi:hypothetical protein
MKRAWKWMVVIAAMLAATIQPATAQSAPVRPQPFPPGTLLGTIGACNNLQPGGPCTQTSTLVQLDLRTGALIRTIGPVGFTVNGLAWDRTTRKLYASTAIGDVVFHGLITIDPATGAGTPVGPKVHNFGLPGADSPIHSITIDPILGTMQAWYDEFADPLAPPGTPPPTDTFVWINKLTGVAKEFTNSGIDTHANGLAWQLLPTKIGRVTVMIPRLWNIDSPARDPVTGALTQTAYEINPLPFDTLFGKPVKRVLSFNDLSPTLQAALGDFNPADHLYYGLSFQAFNPGAPTFIVQVDPQLGDVTQLAQTVDGLHVITFIKN